MMVLEDVIKESIEEFSVTGKLPNMEKRLGQKIKTLGNVLIQTEHLKRFLKNKTLLATIIKLIKYYIILGFSRLRKRQV